MPGGFLGLADLDRAIEGTQAIIGGIRDEQWTAPTPCPGLDVRALVNHPPPPRDADHLGGDPLAAFRRAAAELREALARPGVLAGNYTLPVGTVPGVALARIRIVEHLGHGWDLARATGQLAGFPGDVTERALAAAKQQLANRPDGEDSPFASEVPVPAQAPAIDRLAGFPGRSV